MIRNWARVQIAARLASEAAAAAKASEASLPFFAQPFRV